MPDSSERHGVDRPWDTRQRVAVALTGAPGGEDLVRQAALVASRSDAELVGIHVRIGHGGYDPAESTLEAHKQLLTGLGGAFREVVDADVAKALVATAVAEHATQLVLGASRRTWWTRLRNGSVINSVIAEAGGSLDVHVIADSSDSKPIAMPAATRRLRISRLSRQRQIVGLLLAILGLPLLTLVLIPHSERLGFTSVALCFLLAVVAIGAIGGAWVAVLAAIAGFLLLNFYFAAPVHTFTISSERDAIALTAFLMVAAVVSTLVERAERRSADALRARTEAQGLASMAGALLREDDPLDDLMVSMVTIFRVDGASLVERDAEGHWHVIARAGTAPPIEPTDAQLALSLNGEVQLALAGPQLGADARAVVNAFATQLAVALESRRLRNEAATAAALAKANDLRTALLAAVSHDLRTPLAAIKASTSTLLDHDVPLSPDSVTELLETVDTETDRLNDLVGNLLDLGRIEAGAVSLTSRPTSLESIIEEAIAITAPPAAVSIDLPPTLPLVTVDAGILERAVGNLLDNASRYATAGSTVRLQGARVGDRVELRIIDHGPGIAERDRERAFAPFERLERGPESAGVGLGLAVARGFIEALDGTLSIEGTPGGGTTMVISLPTDPLPADAPGIGPGTDEASDQSADGSNAARAAAPVRGGPAPQPTTTDHASDPRRSVHDPAAAS